jgi:hypothetical protein
MAKWPETFLRQDSPEPLGPLRLAPSLPSHMATQGAMPLEIPFGVENSENTMKKNANKI